MRTDFLFAMPSFWSGMARSIDVFGLFTEYNESQSDTMADARALYHDWYIVGEDLARAMNTVDDEQEQEEKAATEAPQVA